MSEPVVLPLWAALLLAALAAWAVADRLILPAARGLIRRRTNRLLDKVNTRLKVQIAPFKITRREVLVDRLIHDPAVQDAAADHAREAGVSRESAAAMIRRYAEEIVPSFNAYIYFRVGYAIARNIARSLYRVRLGYSDEEGLSRIGEKSTVVFLINHRSNMDYILVAYLASEKAALSFAAGEWARVWPLQTLVKSMGAYFVRRNSRDSLYRKVLERYVAMATAAGVTQAVFPEGGLSRDGRLRPPKMGILDYMLRGFDPDGSRDIAFIPVGINYDRVFEDRTFLLELSKDAAKPKASGTLRNLVRFVGKNLWLRAHSEWHRFGYACVNFGSPVSAREWTRRHGVDFRRLGKEERFARVEELARDLMSEIARVIPAVPVALAATVFVRRPESSFSELELKSEILRLIGQVEAAGAHVYVPRGDQDYAIRVGLRMLTLRRLVDEKDGLYRAVPEEIPLLTYYANSIAHLFEAGAPASARAAALPR
jgi:glycerol-3-phosphate O-acyltransferase